jgi:hypothetical protein
MVRMGTSGIAGGGTAQRLSPRSPREEEALFSEEQFTLRDCPR